MSQARQQHSQEGEESDLRILSWNIGHAYLCRPPINRVPAVVKLLNDDLPSERDLEGIVHVLEREQPHVVAFYELPSEAYLTQIAQNAARNAGRNYIAFVGPMKPIKPKKPHHYKYVGALIDTATNHACQSLDQQMAIGVTIHKPHKLVGDYAKDIDIIGYHGAYGSPEARQREVDGIIEYAKGKKNVILVGDFNARERWHFRRQDREGDRRLFETLRAAGFDEVSEKIPYTTIYHVRVDNVFSRGKMIVSCRMETQGRRGVMDHYPLLVDARALPSMTT